MKDKKKLAGIFAVLSMGVLLALPAIAEEKPDCVALDRQNTKIIGQIINIFADSTGSSLIVKETPENGYVVEGSADGLNRSLETQRTVATMVKVAQNHLLSDKSNCRYVETEKMTSVLIDAVESYYKRISDIKNSM